jgi:hypothetical protein
MSPGLQGTRRTMYVPGDIRGFGHPIHIAVREALSSSEDDFNEVEASDGGR